MTLSQFLEWYANDNKLKNYTVPLFIAVYIAISVLWYYTAKEATAKATVFNKKATEKFEMLATIDKYENEKKLLVTTMSAAGKNEIGPNDVNSAQADVIAIGKSHNLKLETVNVTDSKDMQIEMIVQGRWLDAINYLKELERSKYFIRIDTVYFDVGQGFETKLSVKYKFFTTLE